MTRITARTVHSTAYAVLERLTLAGLTPPASYLRITGPDRTAGITWGVRAEHVPDGATTPVHVPTVLDHALDGVFSTREAWQILAATVRTLDHHRPLPGPLAAAAAELCRAAAADALTTAEAAAVDPDLEDRERAHTTARADTTAAAAAEVATGLARLHPAAAEAAGWATKWSAETAALARTRPTGYPNASIPLPGPDQEAASAAEEAAAGCSCGMADYGAPGHEGHPDFDPEAAAAELEALLPSDTTDR